MEDAIILELGINEDVLGIFGVFDGHGGEIIIDFRRRSCQVLPS